MNQLKFWDDNGCCLSDGIIYKDGDTFTLLSGVNKVILVGNVTESHVIRDSSGNWARTSLLLATSEWWTDKNTGHKQEKTEWHRITIFGELSEYAFHCYQGTKVYIEGRLQTNTSLENTETNRYASEVIVSSPNGVIERLDPPYVDYVDPDTVDIDDIYFYLEPF
jgi:single-strand DNA-binding protein